MKLSFYLVLAIMVSMIVSCGTAFDGKVYRGYYKNKEISVTINNGDLACISVKYKGAPSSQFKTKCYSAVVNGNSVGIQQFNGSLSLNEYGQLSCYARDLGLSSKSLTDSMKIKSEFITLAPYRE